MVLVAATLFGLNGTVSKVVLASGISAVELVQVRSIGAFVGFALAIALWRPGSLRVTRRELPFLAAFGIGGVAMVQWLYFISIHRLPIGIALLLQYLAPLIVALFAHYVMHQPVRRRIWAALACSLAGLALIVEVWSGGTLDGIGIVAAIGGAFAYAVYVLLAEREVGRRDPGSLLCYGFLFAALFWALARPIWGFPAGRLDHSVSLLGRLGSTHAPIWLLMLLIVVVGTMVTFALIVGALRHITATRLGIVAMLEPVAASVVAYAWLGETFGGFQLAGGAIVLAGILLAQSAR
jgi:drug/metabolite transporter (DMT)-like permease